MSIRSTIGWNTEPFRGRYIHYDGNPQWTGKQICLAIRRDGVKRAMSVFTEEHYGWSCVETDAEETSTSYANYYDEPRFENVAGYGIAYTDYIYPDGPQKGYQQTNKDAWVTEDNDCCTEWQYAVSEDGTIDVYNMWYLVGTLNAFDDDFEEKLTAISDSVFY